MKNRIKTLALIAIASVLVKSANAQDDKTHDKIKPKISGISVTPAILGVEPMTDNTYCKYIISSAGISFGLNKDLKISPFLNLSANMANIWIPDQKTPLRTFRYGATVGGGIALGKLGASLDAGIAIDNKSRSVMSSSLCISAPICNISNNISMGAFSGLYVEKIAGNDPTHGAMLGISLFGDFFSRGSK